MNTDKLITYIITFIVIFGISAFAFLIAMYSNYYTIGTQTITGKIAAYSIQSYGYNFHYISIETYGGTTLSVNWLNGNFNDSDIGKTCTIVTKGWNLSSYNCS